VPPVLCGEGKVSVGPEVRHQNFRLRPGAEIHPCHDLVLLIQYRLAAGGGAAGVRVLVGQPFRDLAQLVFRFPDVISDKEGTGCFEDGPSW
jgi:hypothetical protein